MEKVKLTQHEQLATQTARYDAGELARKTTDQGIELSGEAIIEAARAASTVALLKYNEGHRIEEQINHSYIRKVWREAYIELFVNAYKRVKAHKAFVDDGPGAKNIYDPFYIHDEGGLRYSVKQNQSGGAYVARHLNWTDAVFVAESLNGGHSSPELAKLLAPNSKLTNYRLRPCQEADHGDDCYSVFSLSDASCEVPHITYHEAYKIVYGCDPVEVE